jgi:predicted metal-dependent hydrolase
MPRSRQHPERPAAASAKPLVRVVRSPRRRKTVTAYRDGDTVVVLLPSRMTKREEAHWVTTMLERLDQRERRRQPPGDADLERRARVLASRYLDGSVEPRSVRWVGNMRSRYGSCTPDDGTIRLSDRIAPYPSWVRDYVLIHELVHLLVPNHSAVFWNLVARYPLAERARGFLIAKGMDDDEGTASRGAP